MTIGLPYNKRARVILAALCLAEEREPNEPDNVGDALVGEILDRLVAEIDDDLDGTGRAPPSELDAAALELARSRHRERLVVRLVEEMRRRRVEDAIAVGGVCAAVSEDSASTVKDSSDHQKNRMRSGDVVETVAASLAVMYAAFKRRAVWDDELIDILVDLLREEPVVADAAAWALWWLSDESAGGWRPSSGQVDQLVRVFDSPESDPVVRQRLLVVLGNASDPEDFDDPVRRRAIGRACDALGTEDLLLQRAAVNVVGRLRPNEGFEMLRGLVEDDVPGRLRGAATSALGGLGDPRAVPRLVRRLDDELRNVRAHAGYALGNLLAAPDKGDTPVAPHAVSERADLTGVEQAHAVTDAVAALERHLDDPGPEVRAACAWALGRAGAAGAFTPLEQRVRDKHELSDVRSSAAEALREIDGTRAIAVLAEVLDDDEVRAASAAALAGTADPGAADVLLARVVRGRAISPTMRSLLFGISAPRSRRGGCTQWSIGQSP